MGFGMGCCCLQVTFQAVNIDEARWLYDQLTPITPILVALSASTPIFRSYLADVDSRWDIISAVSLSQFEGYALERWRSNGRGKRHSPVEAQQICYQQKPIRHDGHLYLLLFGALQRYSVGVWQGDLWPAHSRRDWRIFIQTYRSYVYSRPSTGKRAVFCINMNKFPKAFS